MKKIRKIAENPIMALFMCSLILFVSCNQDDIATNSALNELCWINENSIGIE